jgi:hypothetical protein
MLEPGAQLPDVKVWTAPSVPAVSLREAIAGPGLALVCSYAFDWSAG